MPSSPTGPAAADGASLGPAARDAALRAAPAAGPATPAAANPAAEDAAAEALAVLATEWFKAARRAARLVLEVAPARLERERAQLAWSARRVAEALAGQRLRLHDFDGAAYSPALPVEPVNPEDFASEAGLTVAETLEPTILRDGRVLRRGKVVLALAREA